MYKDDGESFDDSERWRMGARAGTQVPEEGVAPGERAEPNGGWCFSKGIEMEEREVEWPGKE